MLHSVTQSSNTCICSLLETEEVTAQQKADLVLTLQNSSSNGEGERHGTSNCRHGVQKDKYRCCGGPRTEGANITWDSPLRK